MSKFALMIENSRAYGRALSTGAATFMRENHIGRLVIVRPDDPTARQQLLECDGVIARVANERTAQMLISLKKPVVDVFCQKPYKEFAQTDSDHEAVGRKAAKFFLARHFADYAFCGTDGQAFSDQRRKAFVASLESDGQICHVYQPPRTFSSTNSLFWNESGEKIPDRDALAEWLSQLPRPVAIFCCNDLRAYQVLTLCNELKIRVPMDAAILGVDNDEILCSFAEPPLSSVDPNAFRIGYAAARLLTASLKKAPDRKHHRIWPVAPGGSIERQSTEFYALNPAWLSDALIFIDANLNRVFSVSEVFRAVNRSHTAVERAFRTVLNSSVIDYVTERRLQTADNLLAETEYTIKEIASRCGFSSPQYFCRVYKTRRGRTPRSRAG